MNEIRRRIVVAAAFGLVGIALLARFSDAFAHKGPRILALTGVAFTCCGIGYALALVAGPAPRALAIRHLAAGAAAAWLAYELASAGVSLGISADSDAFRVLWAPTAEELCKAALLAIVLSPRDELRGRLEIVTAAVGVAAGFAIRENFIYFGAALGTVPVYLEWVVLRAIPPVLAHITFGLVLGGSLAQARINARIVGQPVRTFSLLGVAIAVLLHAVYNFVALVITRATGAWSIEVTALWSLVAVGAAFALRHRIRVVATLDEPIVTSFVPSPDRSRTIGWLVGAALVALWLVPHRAARELATVLAPFAIALALTIALSRRHALERPLTPLVIGIALRPLVKTPELMLSTLAANIHPPSAVRVLLATSAHVVWLVPVALIVHAIARRRSVANAVLTAFAVAGGLAAASVGAALATTEPHAFVRAMVFATLTTLPHTELLAIVAVRWAHRTFAASLVGAIGASMLGAALQEITRRLPFGWPLAIGYALACSAATGVLLWLAGRSARDAVARQMPSDVALAPAVEAAPETSRTSE